MTHSSTAPGDGTGSQLSVVAKAGIIAAWAVYVLLHVVYRALWLPCDLVVFAVAYVMHERGATRARVLVVCTLLVAALDVAAGLFLWFLIEVAIPRSFGHILGAIT